MKDTDKIKMRIKIAGMTIPLTVDFAEQDHVRETEKRIAELFDNWHRMFPSKSETELLGMMTYQYASYYLALSRRSDAVAEELLDFEKSLDRAVLDTE